MGVFEELQAKKQSGEKILFDNLTVEDFRTMYIDEGKTDYMISMLFDIKESKVTYRRRRLGITIRNSILDEFLMVKSEKAKDINSKVKFELLKNENITMISKAITHFAFRNGPIEDMHANPSKQITDTDMMILNKYMVNRVAYIFKLIIEERWMELDFVIRNTDKWYGHDWDEAQPDDGDTRKIIELLLKK